MTAPFFSVEKLTKRFGGLTAGKSMLLRLSTKILRPNCGRIAFNR